MGHTAGSSTEQDYWSLDREIFGSCPFMIYICDFSSIVDSVSGNHVDCLCLPHVRHLQSNIFIILLLLLLRERAVSSAAKCLTILNGYSLALSK